MKKKIKVGIIGCGTIGSDIALACQKILSDNLELIGICDLDPEKARVLQKALKKKVPISKLDELIRRVDLVIEAASAKISAVVLEKCIKNKKDVFIMSIGGLLGNTNLLKRAEKSGVKVYLPSGAICGLDGLKSAATGKIYSVALTTRKPLKGLTGAPYIIRHGIDLNNISEEKTIFEGSAKEAVAGFPQNVNVSAVLSLAGIGGNKTRVKIVTSPDYSKNIHEVEIRGEFGKIATRTENVPSRTNPRTSALAIFSAIATLKGMVSSVRIGT